jgi:hypothetical protein
MSVLNNQSQINPAQSFYYGPNGTPQIYSSTFTFGAGSGLAVGSSTFSTILVPGMVSTSGISLTYEHPGSGGAGQFIRTLTPGLSNLNAVFAQAAAAGDTFNLISVNPS